MLLGLSKYVDFFVLRLVLIQAVQHWVGFHEIILFWGGSMSVCRIRSFVVDLSVSAEQFGVILFMFLLLC